MVSFERLIKMLINVVWYSDSNLVTVLHLYVSRREEVDRSIIRD